MLLKFYVACNFAVFTTYKSLNLDIYELLEIT